MKVVLQSLSNVADRSNKIISNWKLEQRTHKSLITLTREEAETSLSRKFAGNDAVE